MEIKKPDITFIPDDELEEYYRYNNTIFKIKPIMEKQEVYNRINGELNYQDLKQTERNFLDGVSDEEKPVAEWLNYIEFHLEKAKGCNYHLKKQLALAEIRKVAALSVKALMIHGCPEREFFDNKCNQDCNK